MIRKRHIFYVEGYDPQGADGYYRMFRREWKRFLKMWRVEATLGELEIDSDDIAHWNIESSGPNWQVTTRYEFLRLEAYLSANLAQPIWWQVLRAFQWMLDDVASGTLFRVLRAAWRFELHLFYAQALLLAWLGVAVVGGFFAARLATYVVDLWPALAVVVGIAAAIAIFALLRPLADRWFVTRINNCWPHLREFARGRPTGYDRSIDLFAERIAAAARTGDADEIVIIGHSAGGVLSPVVAARALELDPALGRHGPRVVLLTLGSLMPACALHPAAERLRAAIRRLAVERSVLWVDCQARKDVMNFWDFDPVAGVGIEVGAERSNPIVWRVRFRDMLGGDIYRRLRANYFRLHYQFIMGNDLRAPYDYFMLVCGPVPVEDWARRSGDILKAFSADAAYAGFAPAMLPPSAE